MKKRILACLCVLPCALSLLSGCALYGNDRSDTRYVYMKEEDGKVTFYGAIDLTFDIASRQLSFETQTDIACFADPAVLQGDTFPRHSLEGDERLAEKVLKFDKKESPCVQAYALEADDGTVYGFCNVYTSATGMLSGGGQIDVKKIERGILFTYSPETDTLTVLEAMDKACVVAFNGRHYIYFNDRSYYSKELGKESVKLCEDGAYDTGMTHYSYANFYFNEKYCIFKFHRGHNNDKKDYDDFLLYTITGEQLATLHVLSNF